MAFWELLYVNAMLVSSFLAFFFPVDQPEATYPIDSSRLKTCGIYAQSTIFGSASLFAPLSSPKLHLNDAFAALMHSNSNRANARWPLNASKCPHRMWLLLENLVHYLHVLNSLALPHRPLQAHSLFCCWMQWLPPSGSLQGVGYWR